MIPTLNEDGAAKFDPEQWKPNAAQAKLLSLFLAGKTPIALCGGWGCGKTTATAFIIQAAFESNPGEDGIIVTDSMARGARTVGEELARLLAPIGWTFKHFSKGVPAPHWLSPEVNGNQSKVWILSWKRPSTRAAAANSIEGPSVGYAILDEAQQMMDEEVAVAMLGRIRSGRGQLILMGKPTYDPWWIRLANERGGAGFYASSACNAHNLPDYEAWRGQLSEREVRENLDCIPTPPEGAILDSWEPVPYPAGNLAPAGWKPEPWMRTVVAFDFGVRYPAALVISHDPRIGEAGADVIWSEAAPDGASVFDVCRILRAGRPSQGIAGVWPQHISGGPEDAIPVSVAFGDKSGRARRDDAGLSSAFDDVAQHPSVGGMGLRVHAVTDERTNVIAGIKVLWRLICDNRGRRSLLCSQELWNAGRQQAGRSIAASILGYKWQRGSKDVPVKGGPGQFDHHIDALRYWAVNQHWPQTVGITEARDAFRSMTRTSGPYQPGGNVGVDR